MKKLILTGMIACSLAAYAENGLQVGAGLTTELSPYQGVGTEVGPLLVLNGEYNNFYIQTTEIGYHLYENEKLSLDIFFDALSGESVSGSDLDSGYDKIEDRDSQTAFGASLAYKLGNNYEVEGSLEFGSEGNSYTLEGSKLIFIGNKTVLKPGIYATFNDSDYTNYYYGVTQKEVDKSATDKLINAYEPGSSMAYGIKVSGETSINESWSVVYIAGVEFLSSEVKDSPIVENDVLYKAGLGVAYRF